VFSIISCGQQFVNCERVESVMRLLNIDDDKITEKVDKFNLEEKKIDEEIFLMVLVDALAEEEVHITQDELREHEEEKTKVEFMEFGDEFENKSFDENRKEITNMNLHHADFDSNPYASRGHSTRPQSLSKHNLLSKTPKESDTKF
jgi:hypothetical protein